MKHITVIPNARDPQKGVLRCATLRTKCALGVHGITDTKQEGDGKTPIGRFALRRLWYRADRVKRPQTALPISIIRQKSGWCDDIKADFYNRPVTRPCAFSHERLWRHDRLYDMIVELGHNDAPPEKGAGSAIFLHLEKNNYRPTLGCIAINRQAMNIVLRTVMRGSYMEVLG